MYHGVAEDQPIAGTDLNLRESWPGNILAHYESPSMYRKVSNIRRILVGNKIVDHSDVVGASPAGAASTTSSFST